MNHYFGDQWKAKSAETEQTVVKPFAINAMAEAGVDMSHHTSKTIETFRGQEFDVVVTICDRARETCPFFPGKNVIHHSFVDPSTVEGTDEKKLAAFCRTRDNIKTWLDENLHKLKAQRLRSKPQMPRLASNFRSRLLKSATIPSPKPVYSRYIP